MNETTPPPLPPEDKSEPRKTNPAATTQASSVPPTAAQAPEPAPAPQVPKPMDGPATLANTLTTLLRSPLRIIASMERGTKLPWLAVTLLSIASLAIFGLVIGAFSAGDQLWAAPAKIIGGLLFSSLICLPSLFIFSCLSGLNAKASTISGILIATLSVTSLLLVGFAPVAWLFSTSSNSLPFFAFLCLMLWLISLGFGFRILFKAGRMLGSRGSFHLTVWTLVFLLVTLQMPTTLRPIIGKAEDGKFLNLEEKKFFLIHWSETLEGNSTDSARNTATPPTRKPYNHR